MARCWPGFLGFALAAAFGPGLSSVQGAAPPTTHDDLAQLVRQLGSPKFAERERATRELTARGIAAKQALAAATNDPDAELRARARSILSTVTQADFRARLEAFAADYDGSRQQTLPGWERFSALFGTNQRSRVLFVEMAREEPELLAAYAAGGRETSEALNARCQGLLEQFMQVSGSESLFPLGTLATLLLVGADEDVAVDEQVCLQLYTWMIYQPQFYKNARSGPRSAMIKKLLGMWIVKDTGTSATMQNLIFAAGYDLEPEGLALATRILEGRPSSAQLRQFALLAVGRFGDRQHLRLVEKFLTDPSAAGTIQLSDPPRQVDVQVRDVALAVAIQLTSQNAKDYGHVSPQSSPQASFQVPALAFVDAAQREAALKRFREWREAHPEP
jgi:hypothetical protein